MGIHYYCIKKTPIHFNTNCIILKGLVGVKVLQIAIVLMAN